MKDCRDCRDYKSCPGKPWYHFGEIKWCTHQVIWIIKNSAILLAGNWPPNPDSSSYIDPGIKTGYANEAYYTKPTAILGEVNRRLARTGLSGKLLRAEVLAGLELSPESKDALGYASRWWAKKMSFSAWRKQRKYHQKV